jgi:hypothetical protein
MVDRALAFSSLLAVAYLLIFNFSPLDNAVWVALLAFLTLSASLGIRRGVGPKGFAVLLFSFGAVSSLVFLRAATMQTLPKPDKASLYS